MKKTFLLAFAVMLLSLFSGKQATAQTKEDASNAFNAALELSKTDMAGAVVKMQEVMKMCTVVGKDADSLKIKVTKVLPVFQFNVGNNLYNEKKFDQAIPAYEKSLDLATTYDDANIKEKSGDQLAKLYFNKGANMQKADNSDSAILFLDKSLKIEPDQAKAMYYKGLAYKKKGDNLRMMENMNLAVASASKVNDTVTVKAAKKIIGSNFYQEGVASYNKKTYADAVTKLNSALENGYKTKDLYFVLAVSQNNLKKYDEAIEAANAGMAMDEQTNEKMARYNCEIAKGYEGKKDNANACAYYKKSTFGATAAFANDKIKNVLKCQ
jgi:tetratricopeptide (TPR) repeat protein